MTVTPFKCLMRCASLIALAGMLSLSSSAAFAASVAPRLEFTLVGTQLERSGASFVPGEPSQLGLTGLYRSAALANIDPNEAASVIDQLPSNAPFVLGRYAAATGKLVVEIYKVERQGTRTGVYRATFRPAHGALWAEARTYMDPSLIHGLAQGADPFARFVDASDPNVFRDVSFDAAQVIMGHAMRYISAPMGVLVAAVPRVEQTLHTTRGAHMRKSVQLEMHQYLDPEWYIAAPPSFQPGGSSAAICLNTSGCSTTPYLVAPAMVTFQEWQGGTMPATPTYLGPQAVSDSSTFRLEDFVVAAYVYTFAASSMQSAILNGGGSNYSLTANLQNLGGMNETAPIAGSAAGFYAGLSNVVNEGSLAEVQAGYRSAAGQGTFNLPGSSPVAQNFISGSETQVIQGNPLTGGMEGVKSYYVGDCAADQTFEQCTAAGQSSGVVPRADTYVELDAARFYQDTTR